MGVVCTFAVSKYNYNFQHCVFVAVASTVKQALQDSLVQILQPKRRVDILRDVMEAQSQRRPFVITFCGVNGVGKSTNLAKVSYHS